MTAVQGDLARKIEELERELGNKDRELTDSLLRVTATADVLRIISNSATDVQAVFDAIVSSSKRLLNAHTAVVTRLVGSELELAAFHSRQSQSRRRKPTALPPTT